MALVDVISSEMAADGSLVQLVSRHFRRRETKPPFDPETGWIRASGFHRLCPREEVLRRQLRRDVEEEIDTDLLLTFLHGTSLHWGVQNELLPALGVLYGTWSCLLCGRLHGDVRPGGRIEDWAILRPIECSVCRGSEFQYVEHHFQDPGLRLSGHADGFLSIPGRPGGWGVLELKSISAFGARQVRDSPRVEHVVQAHAYLMFTGFRWAKILYWVKGENGRKALIEHDVDRDEDLIGAIRDSLRSLVSGCGGGPLPERICATDGAPRAASCCVRKECFS